MTRRQILITWVFSSLISGVLFYAGVAAPLRARRELARLDNEHAESYWESSWLSEQRQHLQKSAEPNYYIGFAIPLVLIGSCAVLAAGYRGALLMQRPARGDRASARIGQENL
jgi:hypothetical protein